MYSYEEYDRLIRQNEIARKELNRQALAKYDPEAINRSNEILLLEHALQGLTGEMEKLHRLSNQSISKLGLMGFLSSGQTADRTKALRTWMFEVRRIQTVFGSAAQGKRWRERIAKDLNLSEGFEDLFEGMDDYLMGTETFKSLQQLWDSISFRRMADSTGGIIAEPLKANMALLKGSREAFAAATEDRHPEMRPLSQLVNGQNQTNNLLQLTVEALKAAGLVYVVRGGPQNSPQPWRNR